MLCAPNVVTHRRQAASVESFPRMKRRGSSPKVLRAASRYAPWRADTACGHRSSLPGGGLQGFGGRNRKDKSGSVPLGHWVDTRGDGPCVHRREHTTVHGSSPRREAGAGETGAAGQPAKGRKNSQTSFALFTSPLVRLMPASASLWAPWGM